MKTTHDKVVMLTDHEYQMLTDSGFFARHQAIVSCDGRVYRLVATSLSSEHAWSEQEWEEFLSILTKGRAEVPADVWNELLSDLIAKSTTQRD